jgi:hypothetical protein
MTTFGFDPEEIVTAEPTRSARLKWVIVVDEATESGRMANAVACVAASTAASIAGLIGPGGTDAAGNHHPGLPWAGCSVLSAGAQRLAAVHEAATADEEILVVDMPLSAQTNRVYDGYLDELAHTKPADLAVNAMSLVGPRPAIERITKRLHLL